MVPQKSKHGIVNQRPGSLHFNVPEGVTHKAHHDPEIDKEPLVLLGLNVPGQHKGIAPVIPAEFQPFYVIVQIEIIKGQVFFKLVLVDFIVGAHLRDAALAVVYTPFSGHYYRQALDFHLIYSPRPI
jgi:hypothetical protein